MAGSTGPNIVNNGLILNLDAANIKSFKGLSGTNLWYNLNRTFSPTNTSTFKVSYGTEQSYIPYFNGFINTTYCDIYNDYNGGSGQCCPSPFYYHGPNVTVNGSTQYTYQLIFKTTNGYYSTNYMYRYEFGTSGLLTEQGVVDASRLESLGNGWYHAWGQFTTNASTTNMTGWLFHYEYLVSNRISVAAVSLTQGSTIHRPEHLINFGFRETRGTTVATGGGWKDLSGNSNNAELVNGATYASNNRGAITTDGTNDYLEISTIPNLNTVRTVELVYKQNDVSSGYGPLWRDDWRERIYPSSINIINSNSTYYYLNGPDNTTNINYITYSFSGTNAKSYKNGILQSNITMDGPMHNQTNYYRLAYQCGGSTCVNTNCNFYLFKIYNRQLTDDEVLQNFNSQKSRFGL